MRKHNINKLAAPADWEKFRRWYATACDFPDMSAEDAYKSLGYEIKRVKKEKQPVHKGLESTDTDNSVEQSGVSGLESGQPE